MKYQTYFRTKENSIVKWPSLNSYKTKEQVIQTTYTTP